MTITIIKTRIISMNIGFPATFNMVDVVSFPGVQEVLLIVFIDGGEDDGVVFLNNDSICFIHYCCAVRIFESLIWTFLGSFVFSLFC